MNVANTWKNKIREEENKKKIPPQISTFLCVKIYKLDWRSSIGSLNIYKGFKTFRHRSLHTTNRRRKKQNPNPTTPHRKHTPSLCTEVMRVVLYTHKAQKSRWKKNLSSHILYRTRFYIPSHKHAMAKENHNESNVQYILYCNEISFSIFNERRDFLNATTFYNFIFSKIIRSTKKATSHRGTTTRAQEKKAFYSCVT